MIKFEDFQKLDLRVAKVIRAEKVEGSEKLMKLEVDLGGDPSTSSGQVRQVVVGIAQFYSPEDLVNKEIVIAANLEPRVLMGLESQGMILAAVGENNEPVVLIPEKPVPPGARIS